MAQNNGPETSDGKSDNRPGGTPEEVGDLDGRRKSLDAALAARRRKAAAEENRKAGDGAGFATALKLSSEFVAGVLVGAGIGYLLDRFAGTAPWGMIVFLLLGFVAGVLNVLRSAGMVAEPDTNKQSGTMPGRDEE
jgi:ATP synthase protein I